jgi:hypothetical protein
MTRHRARPRWRASQLSRAASTSVKCLSAPWPSAWSEACGVCPRRASSYSTLGGTSAYTCRATSPWRSRSRSVSVRTFALMPLPQEAVRPQGAGIGDRPPRDDLLRGLPSTTSVSTASARPASCSSQERLSPSSGAVGARFGGRALRQPVALVLEGEQSPVRRERLGMVVTPSTAERPGDGTCRGADGGHGGSSRPFRAPGGQSYHEVINGRRFCGR